MDWPKRPWPSWPRCISPSTARRDSVAAGTILRGYVLACGVLSNDDDAVTTGEEGAWLEELRGDDPDMAIGYDWMEWLHEVYMTRGPLAPSIVEALAQEEALKRAQEAAALVAEDVTATLASPIDITATIEAERVRVIVNGEVASGAGLMSFGPSELLVEVADAAQQMIMDDYRVWPECSQHNAGLHPELDDGQAMWVCRSGRHVIAPIGELDRTVPRSSRAAKRQERARRRR
jgi:hypothetical protein